MRSALVVYLHLEGNAIGRRIDPGNADSLETMGGNGVHLNRAPGSACAEPTTEKVREGTRALGFPLPVRGRLDPEGGMDL